MSPLQNRAIELVKLNKSYGTFQVLKDFSFSIELGEFLSLLGPSGCGKTTIIRLIAGLENLQSGEILLDGVRIDTIPPYKRPVNTVFQNYALFPHMNVFENIAYGLRAKRLSSKAIKEKVFEALELVQLKGFEKRQPHQMSGGQKQRVSIARAIVNKPPVLLLDEPLTALDLKLRKEMRYELRNLQQKLGITFVYVTHDQEEALVMSDRVAVMNGGVIEQVGTPREIFTHPKSRFAAEFIGDNNIFEGQIQDTRDGEHLNITFESGLAPAPGKGFKKGEIVNLYIRPDKIRWNLEPVPGFHLPGRVIDRVISGALVSVIVEMVNGKEVRITKLVGRNLPAPGQKVFLSWNEEEALTLGSPNQQIYSLVNNFDLTKVEQP
jgi:spermidine/putrescine transport system ATP-binding protein